MSIQTNSEECDSPQKKETVWYKISKPFRCLINTISFPLGCLLFTVIYWLIFIPIFYYSLEASCPKDEWKKCEWGNFWKFLFWTFTSLAWVIIISAVICYWSCTVGRDDNEIPLDQRQFNIEEQKKEKDKLLTDKVTYNNLKHENVPNLIIKNEKVSPAKDLTDNNSFNTNTTESMIEKSTVTLPIRKSIIINEEISITETDNKPINQEDDKKPTLKKESIQQNKPGETMMEEIDKMFPRCSVRRKTDLRKRPDTLIIHSPKYPREEQEVRRFTVQEHPRTASPLTPRELFFQDLFEGAKRQTIERTENFLDNERKHSSNNYANPKKPEVKDYVLKQKSGTSASSPEYFIANVSNRSSCTAEAFLYVDGGQPQEALTICYIDQDDEVFKN